VTTVKADHIRQLRIALEQARSQLGLSTGGYAHPTLIENSTWIYATDFQELRNQILSAWNTGTGGLDIEWLVADQLGTPRMIFDKTGSLANTKRHDYLPFGEELFAGQGGRTTEQSYAADSIHQKFTQRERDNETGLDYFGVRYYSSLQGRFTTPDSYFGRAASPQTLNLYSYVRNNPLKFIDPSGHQDELPKKHGKKGKDEDDSDICDDCVVVINHCACDEHPDPVPQPPPTPTPPPPAEPILSESGRSRGDDRFWLRLDYKIIDFLSRPETPYLLVIPFTVPGGDPYADSESLGTVMLEESDVSIEGILMPGGKLIGEAGSSADIRVLHEGLGEAKTMFDQLRTGGEVVKGSTYPGTLVKLPDGGTVGLRTLMTKSPNTVATIDVQGVRGITVTVKFNPK